MERRRGSSRADLWLLISPPLLVLLRLLLKGVEQAVNWGKDLLLAKVSRYFIIILELVQLFCICCTIRFGGSLVMMMSGTQRGPKRM